MDPATFVSKEANIVLCMTSLALLIMVLISVVPFSGQETSVDEMLVSIWRAQSKKEKARIIHGNLLMPICQTRATLRVCRWQIELD